MSEAGSAGVLDIEKLNATAISQPSMINAEYINIAGKQGDLVNRSLADNVSLESGRVVIRFNEPIWVYDLTFYIDEGDQAKSDKLSRHVTSKITYARGGSKEITMNATDEYVDCYPRDFLTEIEIKFHKIKKGVLHTPPACKSITVRGLSSEDFYVFCASAARVISVSQKLDEKKQKTIEYIASVSNKIISTDAEIETSIENLTLIKNDLTVEKNKLNELQTEVSKEEAKISVLNSTAAGIEERIAENDRSNRKLAGEVQAQKFELDRLTADTNVFMEEYKSYVEQGERNIGSYIVAGLIFLLFVVACLWQLISSALALSNDAMILETISAFDLFISRLPLAFVLGLLMLLSMRMVSVLMSKVFEIHQERLLLSKLSILAKDNSFASAEGLDVEGEVIYNKRVSLKMELLKEFLSGNYRAAAEKERGLLRRYEDFKSDLTKKDRESKKTVEESEDKAE